MGHLLFDFNKLKNIERHLCEAEIRGLCRSQYLGDHEVLCRVLGRYSMFLDTRDTGFAPHMIMDGFWEYWVTKFMMDVVKPGFCTLDIGANFGYYSLFLSGLVGQQGICHAFEPNPNTALKLKKTLSVNGFAQENVYTIGLGKVTSMAQFFMPNNEPKNCRVVDANFKCQETEGNIIDIEVTTIDTFCKAIPGIDFIKIDAEGSEFDILLGMNDVMKNYRPKILLEFNSHRGYDGGSLLDYMQQFYDRPKVLGYDANLTVAKRDEILSPNNPEDWMLYFE